MPRWTGLGLVSLLSRAGFSETENSWPMLAAVNVRPMLNVQGIETNKDHPPVSFVLPCNKLPQSKRLKTTHAS